ncbi:MAG: hypothetical protein Q7T53_09135 [Deltaproteobacteria bacterium]|nr:hypothetical protein [Deltaproteobacteria bacterium]
MTHKIFFLRAQEEAKSGAKDNALYAKALSMASGNIDSASAIYIQLRAEELSAESKPKVIKAIQLELDEYFRHPSFNPGAAELERCRLRACTQVGISVEEYLAGYDDPNISELPKRLIEMEVDRKQAKEEAEKAKEEAEKEDVGMRAATSDATFRGSWKVFLTLCAIAFVGLLMIFSGYEAAGVIMFLVFVYAASAYLEEKRWWWSLK